MNIIYKAVLINLFSLVVSGCATNNLLTYIEEGPGTYEVASDKKIQLDSFIDGVVTSENIIKLCFNKTSDEIENEYQFTVNIPINYLYKKMDELELEYAKSEAIKPIIMEVSGMDINMGCDQSIEGRKIIYSGSYRPLSYASWVHLSRTHKNQSLLFSPVNSSLTKYRYSSEFGTNLNRNVLFISLNNEMHQIITLNPGYDGEVDNYVTMNSCKICYMALPFTFVFDVLTLPFQGIYLILSVQG